jgi:voltage-gated potassium channel
LPGATSSRTEREPLHAGTNKVVPSTSIGAERIAEIILFPRPRGSSANLSACASSNALAQSWPSIEIAVMPEIGALKRVAFFVVQLNRHDGDTITTPEKSLPVEADDGVVVGHGGETISALFAAPAEKVRVGRMTC